MDSDRKLIKIYFEIRDRIDPIATEILNKTKVIEDVPLGIERDLIQRMITFVNNRNEYFENKTKVEAAVHDYMNCRSQNKKVTKLKIAKIHKIKPLLLRQEIKKALIDEDYQFNRHVSRNNRGFSYLQEELLLEELMLQFTKEKLFLCHCRICFLLKLSTFGYEFIKSHNILYPSKWNTMAKIDFEWLQEFEMRHRSFFSGLSKNCTLK